MSGKPNGGVYSSQNLGLYTYSWNNSLKYVDPDGEAIWVPIMIGLSLYFGDIGSANAPGPNDVPTSESVSLVPTDLAFEGIKSIAPESTHTAIDVVSVVGNPTKLITKADDVVSGIVENTTKALKDGDHLSTNNALDEASDFLGSSQKHVAPGVTRSADGTKQVRMTDSDLSKTNNHAGAPHMNFETGKTVVKPNGKESFISNDNMHIFLPEEF